MAWHDSALSFAFIDIKVCKLIMVKVLHTSLLNTTVVAFKALPLGSYSQMPAPSPHSKPILELVLWNGLQSCRCITPDVKIFPLFFRNREKSRVLDPVNRENVPVVIRLVATGCVSELDDFKNVMNSELFHLFGFNTYEYTVDMKSIWFLSTP
jgi:hypothetical protein